jgi:uncharacterized protein with NRDE domain
MCLIVLAFKSDPGLPLVVAANRDEFHDRPTRAAGWWPDQSDILGGRDLLAGGSWLALHRSGRFAAVTNCRDVEPKRGRLRSRGELVSGFLQSGLAPIDYLQSIDGGDYNGFNLLVASADELGYMSNQGHAARLLAPGIYGLANAGLDSPCDKVQRSKQRLAALLGDADVNDTTLMRLLGDRDKGPPAEVDSSRLPFAIAHATTAPFIVMPEFGTRCSTLVSADSAGAWRLLERRFDQAGKHTGESLFSFVVGEDR